MASDGFDREDEHAVEFLTAGELARLDEDDTLERADYWRRSE